MPGRPLSGAILSLGFVALGLLPLAGCSEDEAASPARVRLHDDFDNATFERVPLWTICESSYLGVEFGFIPRGETSAVEEVEPGLDYVLMVAAWDDPDCAPEHCLPLASKQEEEVVAGQERTISLNLPNHQGPCPPEGVAPIPEAQYERIRALWPAYGFRPYAERAQNPQCQ